ncbi:ZIP family metal transporter [Patescibacteria group bacterium]|nr:ZIP family metal transporter [Patescibacteria group bacterium]
MLIEILIAAFSIMLASLVGVLFLSSVAQQFLNERLSYLVAFSAGVFLVTAGALALEVFHIYETALWWGLGLIIGGYVLGWVLQVLLPESHHHHDPACGHGHGKGARKLMVGDAIHNIGDGIILVPAFLASPAIGIAVTISILIHEALQEISEFFVLKQAGYSTKRALAINFGISSTILIGVGLSYFALATLNLEGVLLALSAGFFLHVVVHDLLPKRSQHESFGDFLKHMVVVACGLALMAAVNNVLGDSHVHGDSHDHGEAHDPEHHGAHEGTPGGAVVPKPAEEHHHGEGSDHHHEAPH